MKKAIFITGTDTAVGKSVVTGCLARYFQEKGYNAITQKWVQSGCRKGFSADIKTHLKIMRKDENTLKEYRNLPSPYIFKAAYSAHLASRFENKIIDARKIIKSFKLLSSKFDTVIVEGIGGALVPFSRKGLLIDIAGQLRLPVLVIVRNRLGAINHTLLTVEALRHRKMKILGLVFNNIDKEDKRILEDNPRIIKILTREKILGILPKIADCDKLYKKFIPIADKIFNAINRK